MFKRMFFIILLTTSFLGCKSATLNKIFKESDFKLQTSNSDARQNTKQLTSWLLGQNPDRLVKFSPYIKKTFPIEVQIPSKEEIDSYYSHQLLIKRNSQFTKVAHIKYKQVVRSDGGMAGVFIELIGNPKVIEKLKSGKTYVVNVRINDMVLFHLYDHEYYYMVECLILN